VGCGPGFATLDLAEIVGDEGKVVAVDRSRRFLDALEAAARRRGIGHIATHEVDLDEGELPDVSADGAWVRWVFAFVTRPRELLGRIAARLKPGGVLVVHEYADYGTWRCAPRSAVLDRFVDVVMESWRDDGGEPDIVSTCRSGSASSVSRHDRCADRGRHPAGGLRVAMAEVVHRVGIRRLVSLAG